MGMLQRLYDNILRLAASRHALTSLFLLAFGESFIIPIPPDVLLAPLVLATPQRAWRIAAIGAIGSILGGLVGYYIGFALQPTAHWILAITGHAGAEPPIQAAYARWGFGVVLLGAAPLVPFPIITLSSGLARFSLWQFAVGITLARTVRFFVVTALIKRFGPGVVLIVKKRLLLFGLVVVVAAAVALAAVQWLRHGLG